MQKFKRQKFFTRIYQVSAISPSFRAKKKNKMFRQLNPFPSSRKNGWGDTELGSTQKALFNDFPSNPAYYAPPRPFTRG
jgi:hypothetical protein